MWRINFVHFVRHPRNILNVQLFDLLVGAHFDRPVHHLGISFWVYTLTISYDTLEILLCVYTLTVSYVTLEI